MQFITLTLGLNDTLIYVNVNNIAYFGKTEKHGGYYAEKQYTVIVFNSGEKILVKETPEHICSLILGIGE